LSDAARLMEINKRMDINKRMEINEAASFPSLLIVNTLCDVKQRWRDRFRSHLRLQHFLALLLDARQHMREFAQNEPAVIGSTKAGEIGCTEVIKLAVSFVRDFAETLLDSSDPTVARLYL
jgi:hypothetical protein